ncbi:alpha/beta fold hydrolase [Streptomyces sp. D2-8]|uniref:alpha/beta fold hydrolase n=1 Tax=Streptomyces sp. D2-8 TaxID=2707767 RepID=UPI0020BE70EC|nr:alpha/beta hydrolase [Streptomyces sp. D2-8]
MSAGLGSARIRLFPTRLGAAGAPGVVPPHAGALAARFRVIVPDLRGHGRSAVPDEGNTPAETADGPDALFDGPVAAVGHFLGGPAVSLLAVRHREGEEHVGRTVRLPRDGSDHVRPW